MLGVSLPYAVVAASFGAASVYRQLRDDEGNLASLDAIVLGLGLVVVELLLGASPRRRRRHRDA
jgi:hypothetical protein